MHYRNFILFLVLALLWGIAYVAIKIGVVSFPPVLYAALRYDLAGILMLGYAIYRSEPLPRGRDEWTLVVIGAVFIIAAHYSLLFIGAGDKRVPSAVAAIIASLAPVFTAVLAHVLLPEERLSPVEFSGLFVCLIGVGILIDLRPSNLLSAALASDMLIFLGTFSFAFGSVLDRRIETELPIVSLVAWTMIGGALLLHSVSLALGESIASITLTAEGIASLLFLAFLSGSLGFLIYFDLLARVGPIRINLVAYVAPVFAAIAGLAVLGEPITRETVVGFLVLLIGFVLIAHELVWVTVCSAVDRV